MKLIYFFALVFLVSTVFGKKDRSVSFTQEKLSSKNKSMLKN